MVRPVACFTPSRQYVVLHIATLVCGLISIWSGLRWAPALVPACIFALFALLFAWLATRPVVEIHDRYLRIGRANIPWSDIRRIDRTGWVAPLVVNLTLADDRRIRIFYPGHLDAANSLLAHLRRYSRDALIDGVPYRQFWGEAMASAPLRKFLPSPKFPVLRPEDEAEVERLFQRLKSVGRLDAKDDK